EAYLCNGQPEAAALSVSNIYRRFIQEPTSYRDARSLVIFGEALLSLDRADPKQVLDKLFETAKKDKPKLREVYLASGNLALNKHDYALAAKRFEEGLKQLPNDPDLLYGRARAYAPSDDALMISSLEAALSRNSNHVA